jgi:WD40 repeat protein
MEHVVLEYDLRMATGPIVSSPTRDLSQTLQNQDEVNQITATYFSKPTVKTKRKKGGGGNKKSSSGESSSSSSPPELYLAAADDAGTIRFMEASQSAQSQILHHDPNGVAVVPACTFRPTIGTSNRGLELASGGTDCKIHLWDLLKPK